MLHLPRKKPILLVLVFVFVVLLGLGGLVYAFHDRISIWVESTYQDYLQSSEQSTVLTRWQNNGNDNTNNSNRTSSGSILLNKKIPEKYNLDMEFHSQAPLGVWDPDHEEFCEESSVLMAINYFENRKMTNADFDAELYKMKNGEESVLDGTWESTTVSELKQFIESYFPDYRVEILENITQEHIRQYVAANIPVLLPMSGRTIGNPFYTAPGPVYHVLVIKGYTPTHFITNDVGTKRGKDFFYKTATIMNNIHDYDPENILNGDKRGFVILPK